MLSRLVRGRLVLRRTRHARRLGIWTVCFLVRQVVRFLKGTKPAGLGL